jgi:hypothetical protein
MDIVWQDTPGSFLDPTVIDAASTSASNGDGGVLWSSTLDGSSPALSDLLWDDTPLRSHGDSTFAAADPASGGWQQQFSAAVGSLDVAWADAGGSGPVLLWQPNGWQSQSPFAAAPMAGDTEWTSGLSTPAEILWSSPGSTDPPTLGVPQSQFNMLAGAPAQPSLAEGLGAGGTGSSPLAPLQSPSGNQFGVGGFPQSLVSMSPSQLLWTDPAGFGGGLLGPGSTGGQPPLSGATFGGSLTPLVPTPSSHAVFGTLPG